MPPVAAGAIAVFSAVGAAGAAVGGAIGGLLGAGAAAVGAGIGMGIAQGVLVGALIGGATAAITGGDIGDGLLKGALFGGIGGAIFGGISGVSDSVSSFMEVAADKGIMGAMSDTYAGAMQGMDAATIAAGTESATTTAVKTPGITAPEGFAPKLDVPGMATKTTTNTMTATSTGAPQISGGSFEALAGNAMRPEMGAGAMDAGGGILAQNVSPNTDLFSFLASENEKNRAMMNSLSTKQALWSAGEKAAGAYGEAVAEEEGGDEQDVTTSSDPRRPRMQIGARRRPLLNYQRRT